MRWSLLEKLGYPAYFTGYENRVYKQKNLVLSS